jgi:8-oxo-dGTP diphosphatase
MEVKQIFAEYLVEGNQSKSFNYCPDCRTKCETKENGGRQRPVCPKCGFVQYKNPAPAVSVLVVNNGSVLLGRRADRSFKAGLWCLPCGFIEFDEDFLTAAKREVQEETGLTVDIKAILSVMTNYLAPDLHTLVVVLLAHVVGGELRPGDDIVSVEWFPLTGPLPEMAFTADQDIIMRYYKTQMEGAPVDREFANYSLGN